MSRLDYMKLVQYLNSISYPSAQKIKYSYLVECSKLSIRSMWNLFHSLFCWFFLRCFPGIFLFSQAFELMYDGRKESVSYHSQCQCRLLFLCFCLILPSHSCFRKTEVLSNLKLSA